MRENNCFVCVKEGRERETGGRRKEGRGEGEGR